MKLCGCGCGKVPKLGNVFILGHNIKFNQMNMQKRKEESRRKRGYWHSEETKKKIGEKSKLSMKNLWKNEDYAKHMSEVHSEYGKLHAKEFGEMMSKKLKGRPHSKEHNLKVSESRRGIKFSKEHIRNLSVSHKGHPYQGTPEGKKKISKTMEKVWGNRNDEEKEKILKKALLSAGIKPNKKEEFLFGIIGNLFQNKEYEINVQANVMVLGGKIPDFVNVNGKKKLIELFGDYYHGEKRTGRIKEQEEKRRIDYFKKFGWDTLIIWEFELKDLVTLKEKILNFTYGG